MAQEFLICLLVERSQKLSKRKVHETLSRLLTDRLSRHVSQKISREICIEIYQDIFYTLSEVIKESGTPLSNESVNLLSQFYYDAVDLQTASGPLGLDPDIFTQRAKLENIPTKELALLGTMMSGTPFGDVFIGAVKRRS